MFSSQSKDCSEKVICCEKFLDFKRILFFSNVVLEMDVVIGKNTKVGSNTRILRSVIGKCCQIEDNIVIEDSFIFDNVVIKVSFTGLSCEYKTQNSFALVECSQLLWLFALTQVLKQSADLPM